MHFREPAFLVVAVVLSVLFVGLFAYAGAKRRRALGQLGALHLLAGLTASVSVARRRVKAAMLVLGVAMLAVALARPELGHRWEETHRRGVDLLFAIDTSKSMLTQDVKPDRLERAKLAVRELVDRFPGDRVGLVAFAGDAFLQTPLTLDHAIFDQSLAALDTTIIPVGGTNVASAIHEADKALSGDEHKKVLVLLTDGEDLAGDALPAAQAAAKDGLAIYTVGVGTPSGELIPLPAHAGQTTFVRDEAGNLVTSKLDEGLLRRIAKETGGSYRALGDDGRGLDSLYQDELSTLPRSDLASRGHEVPIERFQWPLLAAVVLLGLEPLVSERRRARKATRAQRPQASYGRAPALAAAAAALLLAPSALASPKAAERAYHEGHFDAAEQEYAGASKSRPDDARLGYNLGAAAYRNGDLDTAAKAFEGALRTRDLKLQQKAYYDLGDTAYRVGEKQLAGGKRDDTIASWQRAIADYEGALSLDAADADAKYNRDFVKKKLAQLQEQKKNDEQQQKKDEPQKPGDQKQKGKQGKGDEKQSSAGQNGGAQNGGPQNGGGGDKSQPQQGKPSPSAGSGAPSGATAGQNPPSKSGDQASPQNEGPGQPPSADKKLGPGDQPEPLNPGAPQSGPESTEADSPSKPGELSKRDAIGLLDSLRGELRVRPAALGVPAKPARQEQPGKDW